MSSSSKKENSNSRTQTSRLSHTRGSPSKFPHMNGNADFTNNLGSPAASEMMLSPPPEEELRIMRRMSYEPSSASKPLASSARSNQPSPSNSHVTTPIPKRKRTVTQIQDSPSILFNSTDSMHASQTPNQRVRKQVRHAPDSPSPAPSSAMLSRVYARPDRSPPPRTPRQDEHLRSPTRKGKGRETPRALVPQSPHAHNPSADYIPPNHLFANEEKSVSYRRRSVTPIPPYEPPPERYTPPREIVVSPTSTSEKKPTGKRTVTKKRNSTKSERPLPHMRIKTEPPEVDLSPAPPASPGDDPILLIGPPQTSKEKHSAEQGNTSKIIDIEMDLELPEHERRAPLQPNGALAGPSYTRSSSSIPPAFDFSNLNDDAGEANATWTDDTTSDMHFDNLVQENIDACQTSDDWSDSDSDHEQDTEGLTIGKGDFTGKFMAYFSPIKMDPPTSQTRERMEEWGRPISPHPKRLSFSEPKEEEDDDEILSKMRESDCEVQSGAQEYVDEDGSDFENQTPSRSSYKDRRGRRLTLTQLEELKFGPSTPIGIAASDSQDSSDSEDSSDDNAQHAVSDTDKVDELDQSAVHKGENSRTSGPVVKNDDHTGSPMEAFSMPQNDESKHRKEGGPSQSAFVNESAMDLRTTGKHSYQTHVHELQKRPEGRQCLDQRNEFLSRKPDEPADSDVSGAETELVGSDNEDDDGETSADLSVVKIMSEDPMAAARAAAILKMHDYDMVARRLQRRKTAHGAIGKAYKSPKSTRLWRRRTIAGLSAEQDLTANVSLPELLEKAEVELRSSPSRSRSRSVSLAVGSIGSPQKESFSHFLYPGAEDPGVREWTKSDWKLLDSCFTDERYEVGEEQGIGGDPAPVDDILFENVVDRFVLLMGGLEMVLGHGPSWTIEKILNRTKVLCKRQRAGEGAPPTPDVSSRFASPSRYGTLSPSSSMILPDFTPRSNGRIRDFDVGSISRKVSLPPPSNEPFFKVPALPPRFSRLRHTATPPALTTPQRYRARDIFGFETPMRSGGAEDSDEESVAQEVETMLTPVAATRTKNSHQSQRPPSAVKRSLSYISSWLKPDTYKPKAEKQVSQRPGLPVPPVDVLARPRGPVETPVPKAPEKAVPHKELVDLDHIDPPPETKVLERPPPRRLVDLNHVPTPAPKLEMRRMSRRSSSSSVKDLVREFESKERAKALALPPRVKELRKQGASMSQNQKAKPVWRF